MSFDPLSGPSTPSSSSAVHHAVSQQVRSISPFAPRSPLPGEQRGYRTQTLPSPPHNQGWNSTQQSPSRERHYPDSPSRDGWSSTARDSPPLPAPPASQSSSSRGYRNGSMQPRAPQAGYDEARTRAVRNDGDDDETGSINTSHSRAPAVQPFVRMRIVGLEKNRKDIYIKFNAESNLPSYRNTNYRAVSRSHSEFLKFAEAVSVTCPQAIVPALPLAQTSAATDDEDDRLVKYAFQKWVARICSDPAIMRDDELRSFIESDFSYTPQSRRKTASSFHFSRSSKLPGEQDDELTVARASMSKLEHQFNETSKVIERTAKARRQAAQAYVDVGDHLNTFATTESYAPLAEGIKRLARSTKVTADLLAMQATNEQVTLGDGFAYQAMNAHSAKETLSSRDSIVDEHRSAVKTTISRRRNIEKLKSSANIKADRVDEALDELDEAKRHEQLLAERIAAISTNLQPSLQAHSLSAHQDILTLMLDHARISLLHEKQLLKDLETLRPELHAIKKPVAGVYYHTPGIGGSPTPNPRGPPQPIGPGSPSMNRTSSTGSERTAASDNSALAHARPGSFNGGRLASGDGTQSMFVGRSAAAGFGSEDTAPRNLSQSSMAQPVQKRTVRSMASSVIVANDGRQKVDARTAASLLANGF